MRSTKLPSWISRLLGFDPVPVSPHVFALSENGRLTYASFHPSAQGYVFETHHSEDLPPKIFGQGVLGAPLREPQLLSEHLSAFLSRLPAPIGEATLILPDAWLRLTFTEVAELPRQRQALDDILRFKLKRLVPFRVEDLRVSAEEVTPFPQQEEEHRVLLGFAIEVLVAQLEDAFAASGVYIGRITNATLATIASLERLIGATDLAAVAAVYEDAYVLCFFRAGEPVLYRHKALGAEMPEEVQRRSVQRDLRMTTSFVSEHFPETPLRRVFLAAPPEHENLWLSWLGDELGVVPEPLAFEHFALSRSQVGVEWLETAPLLGATMVEVG